MSWDVQGMSDVYVLVVVNQDEQFALWPDYKVILGC